MLLDSIVAIFVLLACWRGYRQGFILGLFSFVAVIVGLAAALKLSVVVARYLEKKVTLSAEWLPLVAFILVFVAVVLLIRLGAKALETVAEGVFLGWANRLGGILLYGALYLLVYSVLLFYAVQLEWLRPETLEDSVSYPYLQPWGPRVIDGFGRLVPLFRDMFSQLESFFQSVAESAPAP